MAGIIERFGIKTSPTNLAKIPVAEKVATESERAKHDASYSAKQSGKILIADDSSHQVWYVYPMTEERYLLGASDSALKVWQKLYLSYSYVQAPVIETNDIYYLNPTDKWKYYINNSLDIFNIIKKFGIKTSSANLAKIPVAGKEATATEKAKYNSWYSAKQSGKILIAGSDFNQAWYVYPETKERYLLGTSDNALKVWQRLYLKQIFSY
jgi:hypothetical protein